MREFSRAWRIANPIEREHLVFQFGDLDMEFTIDIYYLLPAIVLGLLVYKLYRTLSVLSSAMASCFLALIFSLASILKYLQRKYFQL